MRRSSRWEGLWLMAVCLLAAGTAAAAVEPNATRPAPNAAHWCISRDLLDHAGLTLLWQQTLPLKKGEQLPVMTLLDERLYVRSDRNYLWSLDCNDGRVIFSRAIATPGFPILGWAAHAGLLICVIDNQLVELDVQTGQQRRVSDLELSIVAPPVRNDRFFYIAAADRRLHAIRARDMVEVFEAAARDDSLITTVVADEDMVLLGTNTGNLLAVMADVPRKLWEFKAVEAIAGDIVQDGNSFFFANKDMNVYRVDAVEPTRASLIWKHQTEAVLDRSPLVTRRTVYQYALVRGLDAIDKQTGRRLWFLPEGVDLLAEAGGRAYVITKNKTLTVMENATGRKLYWVNFASVVSHAANTVDGKIYIADADGHVACLAPIR